MRASKKRSNVTRRKRAENVRYALFVPHPRYGRGPQFTSTVVDPHAPEVCLHPNATNIQEVRARIRQLVGDDNAILGLLKDIPVTPIARIEGTAIVADPSRQVPRPILITHYYDVERICRDCKRSFLFFAAEQQYWYEELGFPPEADCVRCADCRKKEQFLARQQRDYEKLLKTSRRDWKANLKLAECAITLVEAGIFHRRVAERARAAIKAIPEEQQRQPVCQSVAARAKELLKSRS